LLQRSALAAGAGRGRFVDVLIGALIGARA
jgi:hypothetical protein